MKPLLSWTTQLLILRGAAHSWTSMGDEMGVEVKEGSGGVWRELKCMITIFQWECEADVCVHVLNRWQSSLPAEGEGGESGVGHKVLVWVTLEPEFSYGPCPQRLECCNSGRAAARRDPPSRSRTPAQRSKGRAGQSPWPRTSSLQWSACRQQRAMRLISRLIIEEKLLSKTRSGLVHVIVWMLTQPFYSRPTNLWQPSI